MVIHGAQVNFGIGNVVQNINGTVQTREHHLSAESEELKDAGETARSKIFWNFKEECTFTYVIAGNNGVVSYGDLPIIGNYVTINTVSAFAASNTFYYPLGGNTWIVEDVIVNSSNQAASRVSLKLSRYPYINT